MAPACTPADCQGCSTRLVCHCLQVTEERLVDAITTLGLRSVTEVRDHTGAGDGCTACHGRLRAILEQND